MIDIIDISLKNYLILSSIIFNIGITGVIINRKNLLITIMSIELILLSINTNFIAFSNALQQTTGNIFVFFILTVAASETAIGLAIIIILSKKYKTIDVSKINKLKG